MAEIADSDLPDPLSSSPPGFVIGTPTLSSQDIEYLDADSTMSESSSSVQAHPRRAYGQSPLHSSSSAPGIASSRISSSEPEETVGFAEHIYSNDSPIDSDNLLDNGYDHEYDEIEIDDDLFDAYDSEESLFVNDRPNREGDINPADRQSPVSWLSSSEDNNIIEDYLPPRMDRVRELQNMRDELVGMEVEQPRNPTARRQRREVQRQLEVIDLTGDSPVQPAPPPHPANLSARRSQQRGTPPRLERSDASYVNPQTVIDLVSDSDDEPTVMSAPGRNAPHSLRNPRRGEQNRNQDRPRQSAQPEPARRNTFDQLQHLMTHIPILRILQHNPMANNHHDDDLVVIGQRNLLPEMMAPRPNFPPIDLDYEVLPFPGPPPPAPAGAYPKPAHEPPKETRPGFTRVTGEDVVAICPSCDQELAYDPDGDVGNADTPSRKGRTKKDKAEHHFWAVKACGHVYCRKCYEYRKSTAKNRVPVGFRPDPSGAKNKVVCAVEDCSSDVSAKAAWVGIFL
ncbi:hypothetical protein F5Y11DRAFT_348918 [Daldinia sp. FL1419]|nr:hypothetical protein F5Y11DRAFT_348918 [Daldinia sp. FL1419]